MGMGIGRELLGLLVGMVAMNAQGVRAVNSESGSFWLDAELMNVEWRKGCLTTAGCAQPRFKLIKSNIVNSERISISWPVTQDVVQDHSRSFTSHWKKGSPEDVTVSCEIAGVDPTYGFPRICDSTPTLRIFLPTNADTKVEARSVESSAGNEGKMLVELKGKCFNATLAVEKYEEHCPWCTHHSDVAIVEQYTEPEQGSALLLSLGGGEQLLYAALVILAGISVVASTGFACLLTAFLRQKRASKVMTKRHRLYHEQPHIVHPLRNPDSDDTRYEVPWEQSQQYRPLPYYRLGNRSDATMSSPIDSMLATSISDHASASKAPFGTNRRCSPNTSLSERHDDSGLESV